MTQERIKRKKRELKIVEGRNLCNAEIRNSMLVGVGSNTHYLPYATIINILKSYVFEIKDNYLINPEPYYTEGVTIE